MRCTDVRNGKGGRDRDVPLSQTLLKTLREYWSWMKPKTWLFPGYEKGWRADVPITDKVVWWACKEAARNAGIEKRVTPHLLRHTYASEMVRAGVSLPALMTLLGHVKAEMTMKYVLIAGEDLRREFHLARSQPRYLAPPPKAPALSPRTGLEGVVDSLLFAQHAVEMFRRSLSDGSPRHCLDRISNRLTKILCEVRKLTLAG